MKITKILVKFTKNLVVFGDSGVLWEAPSAGKCKMTHYYRSKTTLEHLFRHPKSTSKELKKHPKSPKNWWNFNGILVKITKILVKFTWNLVIFGDSGVLWEAPNAGKCKMTHYYWSKTTLGHLFWHPKSTSKELKKHPKSPKIDEISMKFWWQSPKF